MTDDDTIDQGALDRLRDWGGDRLLAQMIRLFLENAPERMRQVHNGFEGDDLDAVERATHSLKSSASNVGATEVTRLAKEIEALAGEGDLEGARARHDPLVEAHERAGVRLSEVLNGIPT